MNSETYSIHTKLSQRFRWPKVLSKKNEDSEVDVEVDLLSKSSMKQRFHHLYEQNKIENAVIRSSSDHRVATYNIHYWTDLYDHANADRILDDIKAIDATILCLQEVSFDRTKYNPYTYDQLMNQFASMGYIDHIEVFGSQYLGARYGNLILSKVPMTKKDAGLLYKGQVRVKRGYCMTEIASLDVTICCLHLDVFDETGKTRNQQLMQLLNILDLSNPNLIICGDFNCLRKADYSTPFFDRLVASDQHRNAVTDTTTLEYLRKNHFHTCFDHCRQPSPKCTVWSNRVIDFIFVPHKYTKEITNCGLYYTVNSDHFGVYMDFI
jgi:endonuclease/exonuclease/phosphatase family metal-dependent hydrolase